MQNVLNQFYPSQVHLVKLCSELAGDCCGSHYQRERGQILIINHLSDFKYLKSG